jgi:hypothetical protein
MRAIVCAALVGASSVAAQDRPTVLQLPAGARALGVGDAFVAGRSAEVIFYNPAQLLVQPGINASVQRQDSASAFGSVASVMPLAGGALGIGVQYLDFSVGALPVNASSVAASLALNGPPIKSVRIGIAAKFVNEQVGNVRDGGVAFDAGLAKDFLGNRLTIAAAAQHMGSALHLAGGESKLPTRYTLGAAAFAPPLATFFDLAAAASVSYERDGTVTPAGGIEATYVPLDGWGFTGRVGVRRVSERSDAGPLTLGASVSLDRVSLDYGFHTLDGGGGSHRVGLRVR